MDIETINPATEETINRYPEMSSQASYACINKINEAYLTWSKTSFKHRQVFMLKAAKVLKKNRVKYATLITLEMGKLIKESLAEIDKCILCCEHYAVNAQDYLQDKFIQTKASKSYVTYQPLGVVFAIMPWNYPFWQVFRFACPTLMAGNAGLLSHAPISSGVGQAIEEMFLEAGFPENIFKSIIVSNETAGQIIEHPQIVGVTLTGSERAGSIVAKKAGENLKKVVLELGGSDPYIICDDADLQYAAAQIIASRMNNCGQVCIAAKRIICTEHTLEQLTGYLLEGLKEYTMGDPLDADTRLAPLAKQAQRDEVHRQVMKTLEQGASLLLGGTIPDRVGFYYPATLLSGVKPGMEAFEKEVFGPVISLVQVDNLEQAIAMANQSNYGLSAAIFTKDIEKGEKIAREQIQVGTCAVNTLVSSDPCLPFGGIKSSGYGRELSEEGIKAFMNVKTVIVS